ncbi:MAG: VanW family protein, partial [Acidobacteria bacterium]|nr:VanW family protein [Acidobacteriota bacterium]
MSRELTNHHPHGKPAFSDALIFRAKATLLQMNRAACSSLRNETARFPVRDGLSGEAIISQSVTRLWTGGDDAEKPLVAGKVHNLRLAIRPLNGAEVTPGEVFSFWAQIGRPGRRRGYVAGRELREGCVIPTVGGGLCQLSNALYDAALSAGFEIIERHAHTQIIPGSLAEVGRDATVFWNYVDLRFRSLRPYRVEATMDANLLTVRFRGNAGRDGRRVQHAEKRVIIASASAAPHSCTTCNVQDCFRHVEHK